MILSRDQILQSKDIQTETVDCPEWGGSVMIRALTLAQAQEWRRSHLKKDVHRDRGGKLTIAYNVDAELLAKSDARLIVMACVTESGQALFTTQDVEALMEKSSAPVARLALAIITLSGMKADSIEEAEKNSEPNPSDSSASD